MRVDAPAWVAALPTVNATLNGLAGILLVVGWTHVRRGRIVAHKRTMLSAFVVSVAFLACYVLYHVSLHHYTGESSQKFAGTGPVRGLYFAILISHVILAATVPFLAIITIRRGLRGDWPRHRRIARVTFPIWLYVSVTGVIIYGMLYHWN